MLALIYLILLSLNNGGLFYGRILIKIFEILYICKTSLTLLATFHLKMGKKTNKNNVLLVEKEFNIIFEFN